MNDQTTPGPAPDLETNCSNVYTDVTTTPQGGPKIGTFMYVL